MSKLSITKPPMRWLFGGIGFHNSEATMTALMTDKFKNEIALKTFNEISPTFTRVFAVYADWSKEAMDAFADYYDLTFRKAKTLVYAVPGRMPAIMDDTSMEDYCEKVAQKLDYLINVRKCTKIRYYCVTNELSVGNTFAWFGNHLDLFKQYHECLFKAFKRHRLDVGLLATDVSGAEKFDQIKWAADNMDEVTESYCAHLYSYNRDCPPGSLNAYDFYIQTFTPAVMCAHAKEKRFILGEFGNKTLGNKMLYPMCNDSQFAIDYPEKDGIFGLAFVEMAMAAINSGCLAAVYWTMLDYPDPQLRENGDSAEEKARYDAIRFSGHGVEIRYNKNGLIKWNDDEKDYGSRAPLYSMGYMAKLFKKGSRVLNCEWDDEYIRSAAVTNPDGSISIAVLNWKDEANEIELTLEHGCDKKARKYVYDSKNVPYSAFNDLQSYSELVDLSGEKTVISLPPKSVIFLTTDYIDRTPSAIKKVRINRDKLIWNACKDPEHCYYRVYKDGKQIASTVATYTEITDKKAKYTVASVDKWGNCNKIK